MYKKTNKPQKDWIDDSEDFTNIFAFNDNDSIDQPPLSDAKRINHLKLAINKGNFTINPLRVAEKFIQFETQLSA